MRLDRKLAQITAAIPEVDSFVAEYVRMQGSYALVNIGASTVPVRSVGFYPPVVGMIVQIQRVKGKLILAGPAVQLNPIGKIKSVGSPKAWVTVDGKDYFLGLRSGYTAVTGHVVEINWTSGIIQGQITAEQVVDPPPVAPPPVTGFSGLLVQSEASGNWWLSGAAWNSNDPWASTSNIGAWFYGDRLINALAGARLTSAEVYLPNNSPQGAISLGLHPHPSRPGGAPAVSALTALPALTGWVPLPPGFAEALQSGASRGIVVRSSTGFNKFRGVPSDALSGAMRFSGSR
ncbi:hypothetical protein [Mycetocola spongiae]|uniref:hypothetical protein n=1 Tax=Mycetocola spongiae TaxID=2859226 RepID=UPI001CF108B1|nr:hypothetical protein [Mycetocola spongiae]UCR89241.1 hypothetical protein KXZ72_00565 [Mycetocola spongiae]